MAQPRFRFIDGASPAVADAQFWRDAEASERLGSRFKANVFLRELCRSHAWDAMGGDPQAAALAERRLLSAVAARGFALFGPDLDGTTPARLADAG